MTRSAPQLRRPTPTWKRLAIRYYEQIGVMPEPDRTASGYRDYDEEATDRLNFIHSAQKAGLTLSAPRALPQRYACTPQNARKPQLSWGFLLVAPTGFEPALPP